MIKRFQFQIFARKETSHSARKGHIQNQMNELNRTNTTEKNEFREYWGGKKEEDEKIECSMSITFDVMRV